MNMVAKMGAGIMKRVVAALLISLAIAGEVRAQTSQIMVLGIGGASCATWLAGENLSPEGRVWIQGFWTGSNAHNANGTVGASTDNAAILASVRNHCADNPTDTLSRATWTVYQQFARDGI